MELEDRGKKNNIHITGVPEKEKKIKYLNYKTGKLFNDRKKNVYLHIEKAYQTLEKKLIQAINV